jgi:hypothetical protein
MECTPCGQIRNRYFNEWVKTLILCHQDGAEICLFPIIKAMMTQSHAGGKRRHDGSVWRDYLMTAGLMISNIPMMRFANAERFTC